jgi:hypothetical protein
MNQAKFLCYWDSYDDQPTVEYHSVEFFSQDVGYRPDDIAIINDMMRGESIDLSDGIGQRHYVLRVS